MNTESLLWNNSHWCQVSSMETKKDSRQCHDSWMTYLNDSHQCHDSWMTYLNDSHQCHDSSMTLWNDSHQCHDSWMMSHCTEIIHIGAMTHEWKIQRFTSVPWLTNDSLKWFTSVPWLMNAELGHWNDSHRYQVSWMKKKRIHTSAMTHEWLLQMIHIRAMTHEWWVFALKRLTSVPWLMNDLFNWFTSVPWLMNDSFKWFISMPWIKKMIHISAMTHEWWVMALKWFTSVPWLMNDLCKWVIWMPWLINDECDSHSLIDNSAMTHEWGKKWKKNDSSECHDSWMKGALKWYTSVPWLIIYMCVMTYLYVCHDSFICVSWLIDL